MFNPVLYLYRKNALLCFFSPYHTSYLITKCVGCFSSHQAILCDTSWVCACVRECTCSVAQSSLTLCDPRDCSPLGSSVLGVFQVRTLEWIAIISSWGSCQPRNWTCISCISGGFLAGETPGKWCPRVQFNSDTDYMELVSDLTSDGSVPTSDTSCKSQVVICSSDIPTVNWDLQLQNPNLSWVQ